MDHETLSPVAAVSEQVSPSARASLLPYRSFNSYLSERFGAKVYRVPIDVG